MIACKMAVPQGVTSVSWGGETYEVKKGKVEVPGPAVADLRAHGLVPVEEVKPVKEAPAQDSGDTDGGATEGGDTEGGDTDSGDTGGAQ